MTEATEHALEQAERIVQYAKYSDRFMVVEGDSTAERRAFVKLVGQKLPRQVRLVVLRPDSGNGSAALIDQLSIRLHLSAGIETIDQLVAAATAALEGQDRLLIVVENADHWLASSAADALFDLITQSHERARERILFLLVGAAGLCDQAETAQPLAGLVADLHCAQLLGIEQSSVVTTSAHAGAAPQAPDDAPRSEPASAMPEPGSDVRRPTPPNRTIWASPTLLIAAVISIAVITIGVFALLSRSDDPTQPDSDRAIALNESTEHVGQATPTDTERTERGSAEPSTESEIATGADRQTEEAPASENNTATLPDHGLPRYVPFPDERADQPEASGAPKVAFAADTATTQSNGGSDAADPRERADEAAATPVTEAARGAAASTPPTDVDNDWFRDRPRARAAIQLAAFSKLEGAESMIDRFASDELPREQWRIYTQSVNGKVLYTVTFGDFASTERAAHAIDALPTALRELKPYPRSVGAIQDRLTDSTG